MSQMTVSVIVTTKNNEDTIGECLASIRRQTYQPIELIVVDNKSTDATAKIAASHADKVYSKGPERSAQRNYGVSKCAGLYVLIIDSDMELGPEVVTDCVKLADSAHQAIVIPEESFGVGFWAKCKNLERQFYNGVDWIEAPRFFDKTLYQKVGGYNEAMSGGEDWDLRDRVREHTAFKNVRAIIRHNEGKLTLREIIKSRIYYAAGFTQTMNSVSGSRQAINTYKLFFKDFGRLLQNPLLGFGMLFMKTVEFGTAAFSLINRKIIAK